MDENQAYEMIKSCYRKLYDFHRHTFRKSLWPLQEGGQEADQTLNESVHILMRLSEGPLGFLGLNSIECDKCGRVSFVREEDEKYAIKFGKDFPNYFCPYCGKQLINTNKDNLILLQGKNEKENK